MFVPLDRDMPVPLYLQLKEHLRRQIEEGVLPPSTRLAPTRRLAADLGVNRTTVLNAYAELEAEGLVTGQVGRGTFVALPESLADQVGRGEPLKDRYGWQTAFLAAGNVSANLMMRDMLALANQPGIISFAMGAPAVDLLPAQAFRKALNVVLRREGARALQYDLPEGSSGLREALFDYLEAQNVPAHKEEILVTSGSQQGIYLVTQALLRPGETVITERPTYLGAVDAFQSRGIHVIGVPVDIEGLQVAWLDRIVRQNQARLIYTIPTFHNPTGVTLSLERRRALVELARKHDLLILEDATCNELGYEGETLPSLRALDPDGHVVYVGSFSKTFLPGLRVGYLVASGHIFRRLLSAKQTDDLHTSPLLQLALACYLNSGQLREHICQMRQVYRERRDAMLEGLARYLPERTRWTTPQGGLCLWVTLDPPLPMTPLYLKAIEHGVAFALGTVFFPDGQPGACFRLNFSAHPPETIAVGLRRLGKAIRSLTADL